MNKKKNKIENYFNEKINFSLSSVATSRIGEIIEKFEFQNKTNDLKNNLSSMPKVGITTYINATPKEALNIFYSSRKGKDIKNLRYRKISLLPSITVNRKQISFFDGEIDQRSDMLVLGQDQEIKILDEKDKFIPFNDRIGGKFSPSRFIESGMSAIQYPNLTNNVEDFVNIESPSATKGKFKNGIIDVLNTVTALTDNSISDIGLAGIYVTFGITDQEILQRDKTRGSSVVDSKYEIKQSQNVFFEDSQDVIIDNKLSKPGIISTSKYTSSPFEDKIINEKSYTHVNEKRSNILLTNSNIGFSEIGTRYKSMQNGFTNEPFYTTIEKYCLGSDSIAFKGLLRG